MLLRFYWALSLGLLKQINTYYLIIVHHIFLESFSHNSSTNSNGSFDNFSLHPTDNRKETEIFDSVPEFLIPKLNENFSTSPRKSNNEVDPFISTLDNLVEFELVVNHSSAKF